MDNKKFYSARQVADFLGISISTLDRIQRSGGLTPYWVGKTRRFSGQQVMDYLQMNNGRKAVNDEGEKVSEAEYV